MDYATKSGKTSFGRNNSPKIHKDAPMQDTKISVCTDCEWGIFPFHSYLWTSRGLVHQECEDKRLFNETEKSKTVLSN